MEKMETGSLQFPIAAIPTVLDGIIQPSNVNNRNSIKDEEEESIFFNVCLESDIFGIAYLQCRRWRGLAAGDRPVDGLIA